MENNKDEFIQEKQALEVIGGEDNAKGVVVLIKESLTSYSNKPKEQPLNEWVEGEFRRHPDAFDNEEDIKQSSQEIIASLTSYNDNREELQQTIEQGKTAESWVVKKIEEGAKLANTANIGKYADNVEQALKAATQQSQDTFINLNGNINANKNLHGFVAENHHVNSFNIDAATSNSQYRAEMLQSTGKNSVDIVIKDMATGKIVKRYGAKYGQSATDAEKYFAKGDYRGQRKLVADGQELEIENTTNLIEMDEIKSKPLSYKESKEIQHEIQSQKEKRDVQEYNWDKVSKAKIAKTMVQETGKMIAMQSMFQGGRILGRRVWNSMTGKENNEPNQDLKEWFDSSWLGAKAIAIQTAVTTGVSIAVRKGYIGKVFKNTPVSQIANMVYVGMENAKIAYQIAKGKIGIKDGLWKMHEVTLSAGYGIYGAYAGGAHGALLGAKIGTMIAPGVGTAIGTVVGGLVGSIAGGMAGSTYGELLAKGTRKVAEVATTVVKKAYHAVKALEKGLFNTVTFGLFN